MLSSGNVAKQRFERQRAMLPSCNFSKPSTIRKLMVKTPPTEVLVQTCQLVDKAGVKPPSQHLANYTL